MSPVKISRNKKKYFNFTIQSKEAEERGISFSPEKHRLFSTLSSEGEPSGVEIKKFKKDGDDIIVSDFSSVKKTDLAFGKKEIPKQFSTVADVYNEKALYDIVNVSGFVFNLEEESSVTKDGKQIRIRKGKFKDHSDTIQIVLFESFIDKILNENCYDLSDLRVQKFDDIRVLKSTETSKAIKNSELKIEASKEELLFTERTVIMAKIVSINMQSFEVILSCPHCKADVTITNNLAWCECENVSTEEACSKSANLKLTVQDENAVKTNITVPHAIVQQCVGVSIMEKNDVVKKLLNKSFVFTNDTHCLCVAMEAK